MFACHKADGLIEETSQSLVLRHLRASRVSLPPASCAQPSQQPMQQPHLTCMLPPEGAGTQSWAHAS